MATTPTNKPIPSEDPRDLKFNAGKIDEVVNSNAHYYTDRFGVRRWTIAGFQYTAEEAIRNYGYITMDSFEDGATLTLPNQVLRHEATGEYYRWDGEFPKTVSAASTPETSGGIGLGAWLSVGDGALRTEIASDSGLSIIGTNHRGTLQADIDAIDRRPDGYSNSFSAVLATGKDIQLSTDITSETALELSADYQVVQGVGGSLTNSKTTSAINANGINGLKINDFRCVGSIVNGASTDNVAYAVSIVDCTNATVCGVDTTSYTGSVASTRTTDSVIRDVYSRANRYHSDVAAGGYGVLLQGCKRTLVDGINFEADSSKGDLGRHALYVSVVQSDGSYCEDIIAKNIIGRYSGVDDRNMWFINIRHSKRVLVDGFLLQGGNSGIALNTSDGEVRDTQIKNGHLQVLQYGSDTVYGISCATSDSSLINNLLISGVSFDMQTKTGVTATANGMIPLSLNCQRSRIENIKIAGNGASTPILLYSCSLLTIDGVSDTISSGSDSQPFIRFLDACSDISVLNIDTPRANMFLGLDNVTNLTVDFPRFARIVSNSGTITLTDSNSLISSVAYGGTGEIVVTFKNHVTTSAIRAGVFTPASVGGMVILPEVVNRVVTLRFYNSTTGSLVALTGTTVSADIRLNS